MASALLICAVLATATLPVMTQALPRPEEATVEDHKKPAPRNFRIPAESLADHLLKLDSPVFQAGNELDPMWTRPAAPDILIKVGPLRFITRAIGRTPNQGAYYQTWERPRICFRNICPTFQLKRHRFPQHYFVKIGAKIEF